MNHHRIVFFCGSFDILRVSVKICDFLRFGRIVTPQECVHITTQLYFDAVFIYDDAVNNQPDIALVQLLFRQNIAEDVKHRFCVPVGSDDGISRICRHGDLIFQPPDTVCAFLYQRVVCLHDDILVSFCAGEVAGFLPHQDLE